MKKFLSILLCFVMVFTMSSTAFAANNTVSIDDSISSFTSESGDDYYTESYNFVDSVGETYKVVFEKTAAKTTTILYDSRDSFVSESEWITGSDDITTTFATPTAAKSSASTTADTVNISDLVVNDSALNIVTTKSINAARSGGDSIPGSTAYTFYKTYNTDYVYLGNILKGNAYYKKVGTYTEYNRMSYAFQRSIALTTVLTLIGGVYSFITGTYQVLVLAGGMGISFAGGLLTTAWNVDCSVRSYPFDFRCLMTYNGSSVVMSQIRRNLEYLYGKDTYSGNESYVFDDFSYSDPTQAVGGYCSEAVGYAAKAFSIKYITGSDPSLSLPVTGPVW